MALPFIAGIAVGAGAALLFTKRKKVKETLSNSAVYENIQKSMQDSLDKGKEFSSKALQYAKENFNSLTKAESSAKDSTKESKRTRKTSQTIKRTKESNVTKAVKSNER